MKKELTQNNLENLNKLFRNHSEAQALIDQILEDTLNDFKLLDGLLMIESLYGEEIVNNLYSLLSNSELAIEILKENNLEMIGIHYLLLKHEDKFKQAKQYMESPKSFKSIKRNIVNKKIFNFQLLRVDNQIVEFDISREYILTYIDFIVDTLKDYLNEYDILEDKVIEDFKEDIEILKTDLKLLEEELDKRFGSHE